MSLEKGDEHIEKIDKYIRELKAIKYYDKIKEERDRALQKVEELKTEISNHTAKLKELSTEAKGLKEKLSGKEKEVEGLRGALKANEEEAQKVGLEVNALKNRVRELEELKATVEGKTLREAEEAVLRAKDEEIKKRAEELFNTMKTKWAKSEKPKEVLNESIKWLEHVIENLNKPGPRHFLKQLADVNLPDKIEKLICSEVNRRLDAEFLRRVEEKSEQEALEKLELLKSVEWPNWLRANVEPRVKELEGRINTNAVRLLKGPWNITCDKCGTLRSVELTPKEIEDLLGRKYLWIECINPNCMDFLRGRHKIRVSLSQLVSFHITR